jgi:hypothetical protein
MGDAVRRALLAVRTQVSACIVLSACAAPPQAAKAALKTQVSSTPIERFLPLMDQTVFAYETLDETSGERGLLVMEIRRPGPERAELAVAGHVSRVTLDANGVQLVTGGWLLKTPLTVGATFPGDFGTVTVRALDRTVETPAGKFEGCLETVEEKSGPSFMKRTVTAYCPEVGIVLRRTEAESDEGAGAESMRLKSHGPRVDITGM